MKLFVPFALALLASCNTTDISKARGFHQNGEYAAAARAMEAIVPLEEDEDGTLHHDAKRGVDNLWLVLESGKYHIDAGEWELGRQAMREALGILERLDEEAVISMGGVRSGAAGMASDDRQADYVGTTYDRIMVPAYLSLCELMLGNFEEAAVAGRNMNEWQLRAEEARSNLIEQAAAEEEAAREKGFEYGHGDFLSALPAEEGVGTAYSDSLEGLAEWASPAFADYSIPAARMLAAVALGAAGEQAEMDTMVAAVRRMTPNSTEVSEMDVAPGKAIVLFETGGVPYRVDDSHKFMYAYTHNDNPFVSMIKISVPSLAFEGAGTRLDLDELISNPEGSGYRNYERVGGLRVTAAEETHQTQFLSSMSGLVALEFKESLPGIWFREVARVVVREVIQAAINTKLAEEQGTAGMLAGALIGAIVKSQFEPDLRGWESLPAEHQFMVFTTPADGRLEFQLSDDSLTDPVILEGVPTDKPVFIFARSSRPGTLAVYLSPLPSPVQW